MEVEKAVFCGQPASVLCDHKLSGDKKQGYFDAFLTALMADLQPGQGKAHLQGGRCRLYPATCLQPGAEQNCAPDEPQPSLSGGTTGTRFLLWPEGTLASAGDLSGDLLPAGLTSADPGLSAGGDPAAYGQGNLKPAGFTENLLNARQDAGRQTPASQATLWPQAASDPAGAGITEARIFSAANSEEPQKPVNRLVPLPDGQEPAGGWKQAAQPGVNSPALIQQTAVSGEEGIKVPGQIRHSLPAVSESGRAYSEVSPGRFNADQSEARLSGAFSEERRSEVMITDSPPAPDQGADQHNPDLKRSARLVDCTYEYQQPGKTAPDRASPVNTGQGQPAILPAEPAASPPATVKNAAYKEQIMQQIQGRLVYIREKGSAPAEMRLRLQPAEWGEMVIRVFSRQGKLSALIQVEAAVMEILESSLPDLRQRFQQNNLPLEHLELFATGRDDYGCGRFGAGDFSNEQQRFDQCDPADVQSIGLLKPEEDNMKPDGIEYWA